MKAIACAIVAVGCAGLSLYAQHIGLKGDSAGLFLWACIGLGGVFHYCAKG